MRFKKTESLQIKDFIINHVKRKSNLVIWAWKGPAVEKKKKKKKKKKTAKV